MPLMSRILLLLLGLMAAPCTFAADAAAGTGPEAAVQAFHSALMVSMKNGKTASCASRTAQLGASIDSTFDLPFIAQHVLRKRWDGMTQAQRDEFVGVFRDLVIGTYATNFSSYGGETFSTPEPEAATGAFTAVKAQLKPSDSDAVTFEYQLHSTANGWRIVNIIADGVSDLATRTVQYDSVFQAKGIDGLIAQLRDQIAKTKVGC